MAENKRGNWNTWYEFFFSAIGSIVGLGNVWRFPYVCYKNGGGAFLVPYFLFMFLCALPLIFIQLSYSQYSNLGPGKVWICCPLFKGIGYGMVTLTCIISLYYNVILAWTLFYLGNSFSFELPWSHCSNDWNTALCYTRGRLENNRNSSITNFATFQYLNGSNNSELLNVLAINSTHALGNLTISNNTLSAYTRKSSAEEFWEYKVLEISKGIEEPGEVRLELLLCLFLAWLAVFLCLIKGIKSSGKVMYVAAVIPYIFLSILFVRGLMLPGAIDGLKYFLFPRWEDLFKFSVWGDAAVQMFYSAGLGVGGMATLASYNNFNNNCYRDAMILPVIDILTSWFAGMVIFLTLGYMAHEVKVDIGTVVKDGPGVAFMVYPEALSKLPFPQVWSVLFFVMLFTVGLDSQIVHIQTLTGALMDNFPQYLHKKKVLMTASLCFVGFLLGIPSITQGGVYVLTLIDWYCACISIMFLAMLEILVLSWIYGAKRVYKDIELMLGYQPIKIWMVMWKFVTPTVIMVIWLWSIVQFKHVKYGDYVYPKGTIIMGWLIAFISIAPIPIGMAHTLYQKQGHIVQRLKISIKPTKAWKPAIHTIVNKCLLEAEEEVNRTNSNNMKDDQV